MLSEIWSGGLITPIHKNRSALNPNSQRPTLAGTVVNPDAASLVKEDSNVQPVTVTSIKPKLDASLENELQTSSPPIAAY